MNLTKQIVVVAALAACGDGGAGSGDVDAAPVQYDSGPHPTPYALLVTESPPGPDNGDPQTWGGVRVYALEDVGGALVEGDGIPADQLADPVDVLYHPSHQELLIANRHGNNAADGTAGSIARVAGGVAGEPILGNGLAGVHQLALSPTTGELFAANRDGGVSRFTFDGDGAVAHGTISDGATRGVGVSPDGGRLYVTTAGDVIRQFDLETADELDAVTVAPGANLHYLEVLGDELYVASLDLDAIYRYAIASDGALTFVDTTPADSPTDVAFGPTGDEMFVAGHRDTDVLGRFARAIDGSWSPVETIDVDRSLGGVATIP